MGRIEINFKNPISVETVRLLEVESKNRNINKRVVPIDAGVNKVVCGRSNAPFIVERLQNLGAQIQSVYSFHKRGGIFNDTPEHIRHERQTYKYYNWTREDNKDTTSTAQQEVDNTDSLNFTRYQEALLRIPDGSGIVIDTVLQEITQGIQQRLGISINPWNLVSYSGEDVSMELLSEVDRKLYILSLQVVDAARLGHRQKENNLLLSLQQRMEELFQNEKKIKRIKKIFS